ncbi:MAG TPA: DNA-formamidopyrimidine glycosylase family protein [Thermoanaerobaculia bacterium]|jgi:endonuclease-8
MPEGDTIYRAARTLNAALAGRVITRFETVFPKLTRVDIETPLAGRTIDRVVSAGKNLIMEFSGDLHLLTHMRMHGSWHIYRPGERWRKRFSDMRIILETSEYVAVAFNVPVAEFHDAGSLARQDDLRHIGPDFLGEEFDSAEALRRIRAKNNDEIAEVLLNQRVAAGIGNEYKSEILFICRVNPFTRASALDDETLDHLLRVSRKLMLANVNKRTQGRETTFSLDKSQKVYVYGRGGKPCRRCGTPIEFARQGPYARVTYWCPKCQHPLQ